jgi:hypothetical protein
MKIMTGSAACHLFPLSQQYGRFVSPGMKLACACRIRRNAMLQLLKYH